LNKDFLKWLDEDDPFGLNEEIKIIIFKWESVLAAFWGRRTPKKADCLHANARRQYALFIRSLSIEILLNKNRFSLLKNSASSLAFQPMLLPFGSYSHRTLRPCFLMAKGHRALCH
jgi:hypothetical protein